MPRLRVHAGGPLICNGTSACNPFVPGPPGDLVALRTGCREIGPAGPPPIVQPPPEICNGVDDDCDGAIDEGPSASCDDGIPCTAESCGGAVGCLRADAAFNGAACWPVFCARGVCNGQRPPNVDPTLPLTPAMPDANGCQQALDNAVCENVIDRCVCNGTSVCNPPVALTEGNPGILSGCSQTAPGATPLQLWPCENPSVPGADANLCTNEVCCEPNRGCIYLNPRFAQPTGGTTIVARSNELCTSFFVPRRPGSAPGTSCVAMERIQSPADRVQVHCNDLVPGTTMGNPCTQGTCTNQATGQCRWTQLSGARPLPWVVPGPLGTSVTLDPGCFRELQQGCAQEQCILTRGVTNTSNCGLVGGDRVTLGGTVPGGCEGDAPGGCAQQVCTTFGPRGCVPVAPFAPRFANTPDCERFDPGPIPGRCTDQFCDGAGACVLGPDPALCDDGFACTIDACPSLVCDFSGIVPGFCLIDGLCRTAGEQRPPPLQCSICNPTVDQRAWTRDPDLVRCPVD